jgi:hypothetical protein
MDRMTALESGDHSEEKEQRPDELGTDTDI